VFDGAFIANEGFDQASAERLLAEGKTDAVPSENSFIANRTCPGDRSGLAVATHGPQDFYSGWRPRLLRNYPAL